MLLMDVQIVAEEVPEPLKGIVVKCEVLFWICYFLLWSWRLSREETISVLRRHLGAQALEARG